MAQFDDIILPQAIAFDSATGPAAAAQIITTSSGFRAVNLLHAEHLRRFDLSYGIKKIEDLYAILEIWEAVEGPANSFLIRDWNDWNTTAGKMGELDAGFITATDMPLQNTTDLTNVGDGTTLTYQLTKTYTAGSKTRTRTIKKPQNGTVLIAENSVTLTESVDYTIDYSTGLVTFTVAPGSGSPNTPTMTWGGAFYVPVAFVNEDLSQALHSWQASQIANIALTEVKLP
jgi:uncharacterized protein (TIGR02217 family)